MRFLFGFFICILALPTFAATNVVVKSLSELLISSESSAPAQVVNDNLTAVSARLASEVEAVHVKVGDEVKQGQVLAQLECRDYELADIQAKSSLKALDAQVRLARQQLNRAEKLLKQKNASRELRDQRRAELDNLLAQRLGAEARVDDAALAIERCQPVAPFDGVVTERAVGVGTLVNPGDMLLRLVSANDQEVSAALTPAQIASINNASQVFYQANDENHPLALRKVVPLINSRSRTQEVRLGFTEGKALSGSSGRVVWQDGQGRIPVRFIVSRKGVLGIMLLEENKAVFVPLEKAVEGQAAVVSLPLTSQVIIEGQHSVVDGDDVVVSEDEDQGA